MVVLLASWGGAHRLGAQVIVSEFLAVDGAGLVDEDGDRSDWIEFSSVSDEAVNLLGWHLTDDADDLAKWAFPAVVLLPGERLVVFASGKNRADPEGELHANLRLDADGEYLALVDPNGTLVSEFAPAYPAQRSGVSFGLEERSAETTLLGKGADVRYFVPRDATLGAAWVDPNFDDAAWDVGRWGMGFETPADDGNGGPVEIVNLAPGGAASQSSTLSGFTADRAIDGDLANFTHTTAGVNLPATWELDLGAMHAIESIVLHNRVSCCGSRLRDIRVSILDAAGDVTFFESELLNPENELGDYPSGPGRLEIDLVQATGGRVLGQIVRVVRIPDPDLSGTDGQGQVSEPDVLQLGEVQVLGVAEPGAPGFAAWIETDVEAAMHGASATIFARVPFEVGDADSIATFRLRARYDDGFVAYVNGAEVARRHAPAVPAWDATATEEHADELAVVAEEFDLAAHAELLRDGTNWLAVHGLNFAPDDSDFLLSVELVAGTLANGEFRYFSTPTPGGVNDTTAFVGFVEDVAVSVPRGFYDAPIEIELSSETKDAEIRYTLDGSAPATGLGTLYEEPIAVETTTVLRAVALREGFLPTPVRTHSYLFLDDVIRQPRRPVGFPSTWGAVPADYEVDPDVIDDPRYRDEILDGMRSIRSLSLVIDQDDFFRSPRGIYANPRGDGAQWERPVSIEFLHPNASESDTQADCGIRIHGNGSRSPTGNPKHSFRLEFRSRYGVKNLRYALFPGARVDEFDSLILRGQNAHGWTRSSQIANNVGTTEREQSQYIRDSFARDLHSTMGHVGGGATYVHLFVNGLYWGLYNPVEYPRAFFGASHFGGDEEEYDAINRRPVSAGGEGTHAIDGTKVAWTEMQRLADAGLETPEAYEAIQRHINIDNLIDYMLVHQYMGSRDGPEVFQSNNMRAVRRSRGSADVPWQCMLWDMEASMFEITVTRNVNVNDPDTIVRVYTQLRRQPEFLVRYGDRVRRHCFHGGALTPEGTEAAWERRAEEIFTAIIGESARWGDTRRSTPFARDAEWTTERNRLLTTYFPTRTAFLVDLLRRNDLYPSVEPPMFSERGGRIEPGFRLRLSGHDGTAWYTVDGTDPRRPGGDVSPAASAVPGDSREILLEEGASARVLVPESGNLGDRWTTPEFDDARWRSGTTGVGFELGDGYQDDLGTEVGEAMFEVNASVYVRVPFQVDDPAGLIGLTLLLKYDDGFVAYLNGERVASVNAPDVAEWNSEATGSHEARRFEEFDLSRGVDLLRPGENLLATHGLNVTPSSRDMIVLPIVSGTRPAEDAPDIVLERTTRVRARTLVDGEWSALDEAVFVVDSSALRVTEIMYHPAPPPAGSRFDEEDFEFIEVQNTGSRPLNLTGIALASGIEFVFPDGDAEPDEDLQPGEVALIVSHLEAFGSRYDTEGLYIAGEFESRLGNGGERIQLIDRIGETILDFLYSDDWIPATDGLGFSLEIRDASAAAPSWNDAVSWRASLRVGGSPGVALAIDLTGGQVAGDVNQDRRFDLSDPVTLLRHLFIVGQPSVCSEEGTRRARDFNGDGNVDLSDAVGALNFLFQGGAPPAIGVGCVVIDGCPEMCVR